MIRWTVEIISKYAPRDEKNIAYERLRHENFKVPMRSFDEVIINYAMKTESHNKGQPIKRICQWLGTMEHIEETIIGITRGYNEVQNN